jgi:hypothetical protein
MSDRRRFIQRSALAAGALLLPELPPPFSANALPAGPVLPLVPSVDPDRLIGQVRGILAASGTSGRPVGPEDKRDLEAAIQAEAASEAIQRVLDRSCLVGVHINPEMRVKVARGPALPALVECGWRPFLVKVRNEAGTTATLRATSLAHRWLDLRMADDPPLSPTLSGLGLEYRILRLYSREAGRREASLAFDVGQGTQDLGFRNEVPILFDCRRAD